MFSSVNYVRILLTLMISFMMIMSSFMNSFEKLLPGFVRQTFRYGKFAYEKKTPLAVEVPKAWFKHFYVYSSIITTLSFWFCVRAYVYNSRPPQWLYDLLDACSGHYRQPLVPRTKLLLALGLLTLQCLRRAYDTHFVSVFGRDSKMNLTHYLIGYIHYTACVLTILSEAENFTRKYFLTNYPLSWYHLSWFDLFATGLFLWAWYHQYKATVILGNLRKNAKGAVVTQDHKLPKGDWFEYVSSPHISAEILMYTALTLILWQNTTWWYVYGWVLSNQVETALLSHWWYQEKFKDFPKGRKALIPYIY